MKQALLVIDFINELTHPNGKLAQGAELIQQHQVIEHANTAIDYARKNNWLLLFVKVGFSNDYIECSAISPIFNTAQKNQVLQLNSWGTNFLERLHYHETDTVIIKHRVSPFYGTELDLILRTHGIQNLYVSGFSTDMAVQCAVREGHDRDYRMAVLANACGAHNQQNHDHSLALMQRVAKILPVEELEKCS